MERKIEAGDVVQLKSGEPRMVAAKCEGGVSRCVWIDFQGRLQRESFEDFLPTLDVK